MLVFLAIDLVRLANAFVPFLPKSLFGEGARSGPVVFATAAGAALQVSGHTHDGQVFPMDLINGLIYELNWGHLRKGGTHYYVTSGAGTWGPPIRVGSRAEVVRIRLGFSND